MRLLHTSDWHLGRSFHGVDLLDAQARALDGLVGVVREEQVDAVIIAGDLYDRALPPVGAVELWGDTVDRFCASGAQVVVISGNHDSARRLGGGGARLLSRAGVHVRTDAGRVTEPVLLDLPGAAGLAIYAIPYLDPASGELAAAAACCRSDLAERPGFRGVLVAHAFVAGGEECDSERQLTVGGAGRVPLAALTGFDYAALGHLHGQQALGDGSVRYSGSPLAYSFSEERHVKGAWLLDVDGAGLRSVEAVPTVVPRPLARVSGRLDDLLAGPSFAPYEECFLSVTLLDDECPVGGMARLQRRFPHCVELTWQPAGGLAAVEGSYAERVAQPDDLAVLQAFIQHVRNTAATDDEVMELRAALDAERLAEVEA